MSIPTPACANFAPDGEPIERRPTKPRYFVRNVSEFRVRDLAGNFAEWCLDNYAIGYHTTGKDPLHLTDEQDDHVVRGGCGLHDEDYLRCSARDHYHPGLRDNLIGFRCARPTKEGET
jgi:iron(II)-dependent oxidoreductase